LNLGAVHGGDNPNRICGCCRLDFDLRPLPGMNADALRADLRRRLQAVSQRYPRLKVELRSLMSGLPPFETPGGTPFVRSCEALSGHAAHAVAFGTEAPFLASLGMETVVMGPGDIARAHQPDECIDLDALPPAVNLYAGLIRRYCLQESAA
jgi:acetylornithine deacetylase